MIAPTFSPPARASNHPNVRPVDASEAARALIRDTVALCREAPRGARPEKAIQRAKDAGRADPETFSLARWLRLVLDAIQAGQDARLFPELVADVLGATATTVLPLSDASIADTLAECAEAPRKELAIRPDASLADLEEAIRAGREEACRHADWMHALTRRRLELLRDRVSA